MTRSSCAFSSGVSGSRGVPSPSSVNSGNILIRPQDGMQHQQPQRGTKCTKTESVCAVLWPSSSCQIVAHPVIFPAAPKSQRPLVNMRVRGGDEALEQGVRLVRFAAKFGMKLRSDEEGMIRQFNHLDQ